MRKGLVFILIIAGRINIFDCANKPRTLGRIVRGHDAAIGQFPYAVRLSTKVTPRCPGCIACTKKRLCGGALISPKWILTAAHCVANSQSAEIYLGSIFNDSAKVAYDLLSSQYRVHSQYNSFTARNDIALIKIPYTKLCKEIGIVRLPKLSPFEPKYEKAYATACGWGLRSRRGDLPRILQWGHLQILPSHECRHLGIIEKQMCTIMSPDFAAICYGDSGGPLVLETTGELVGIGSTMGRNCENGDPPFFTRVTSYLMWIKSVSGISY